MTNLFPRSSRKARSGAGAVSARCRSRAAAEPDHALGALPRAHGDSHGDRGPLRLRGCGHRRCRGSRRSRWPRRAAVAEHLALRRRARFARRLRKLRRRAGMVLYMWGPGSLRSVGWIAVLVFAMRRPPARALQRHARRSEPTALCGEFLRRHARARRRHRRHVARSISIPRHAAHLRSCADRARLRDRDRASDGVEISDLVGKRVGQRVPREHVLLVFVLGCSSPGCCSAIPGSPDRGSFLYLAAIRSLSPLQEARAAHLVASGGIMASRPPPRQNRDRII